MGHGNESRGDIRKYWTAQENPHGFESAGPWVLGTLGFAEDGKPEDDT